jgi:hypothetical protein
LGRRLTGRRRNDHRHPRKSRVPIIAEPLTAADFECRNLSVAAALS